MKAKSLIFIWALFILSFLTACDTQTNNASEPEQPLSLESLLEDVNYYIEQNNNEEKYSAYYVEPLVIDDNGKIKTEDKHIEYTFDVETDDDGIVTEWKVGYLGEYGTYKKSKMNTIYGYMFYSQAFITATAGDQSNEVRDDFQKWAESTYERGGIETEKGDFSYYNSGGLNFLTGYGSKMYMLRTSCELKE